MLGAMAHQGVAGRVVGRTEELARLRRRPKTASVHVSNILPACHRSTSFR
jgi:hypothetical protein